ncbi:hypothetical protein [Pseudomonas piscis]|uniref:hypothetical protein n=1 Tax=Pseudomonas piscis TaxID=2614538 RepID=UPI00128CD1F9|nr:hypothetical protein [Pseudomonas piscis]
MRGHGARAGFSSVDHFAYLNCSGRGLVIRVGADVLKRPVTRPALQLLANLERAELAKGESNVKKTNGSQSLFKKPTAFVQLVGLINAS